jgi:hypothetical protein
MRTRMRWVTLAGVAGLFGGLLAGGSAVGATAVSSGAVSAMRANAAASRVTVHIKGINRDGKTVSATPRE